MIKFVNSLQIFYLFNENNLTSDCILVSLCLCCCGVLSRAAVPPSSQRLCSGRRPSHALLEKDWPPQQQELVASLVQTLAKTVAQTSPGLH